MNTLKNTILILLSLLLFNCKPLGTISENTKIKIIPKQKVTKNDAQDWYIKSPIIDTLPGISLRRIEHEGILNEKKSNPVIVAVIDMEIDINHIDIKNNIWKNANEIPNNKIDDDNNGYVDDIHGWNFLGNDQGENIIFAKYEYTRILEKYGSAFNGKTSNEIAKKNKLLYESYNRAKEKYNLQLEFAKKDKKKWDFYNYAMLNVDKVLSKYFPNQKYTLKKIDDVSKTIKDQDSVGKYLNFLKFRLKTNITDSEISFQKLNADERLNKMLNINYNERSILEENDSNDISDFGYGNPIVNKNKNVLLHGTAVASVIIPNHKDKDFNLYNNIKLMSLCISPFGDEHDKDIALAIRYAVDNGARVINMSSGKYFSLNESLVLDALLYAEKNNVLFITSAGNEKLDLDYNFNFPNDTKDEKEFVSNFLKIGGIGFRFNKKLTYSRSNFGKKNVDIFAPAVRISVIRSDKNGSRANMPGTSFAAPLTSLTAALILSYYPSLSAAEVKQIIMKSGVSFDLMVNKPSNNKEKELVPFSSLSKSGKIVNAYNALLMAEEVSKKKKRK